MRIRQGSKACLAEVKCGIIGSMEITYLGHSAFKIKTKTATLVTDPYGKMTGFVMPAVSADLITVSHHHEDHDNIKAVSGTARRANPFVIDSPGEYEIEGISVFGYQTYHDAENGAKRGNNVIYVIQAEDLRILHLGDLGHKLSKEIIDELDGIDVVMIPVGGDYTVDAKMAAEIAAELEPYYVIPMHFKTEKHDDKTFGQLATVEEFVKEFQHGSRTVKNLSISKLGLPEDLTEVILFE